MAGNRENRASLGPGFDGYGCMSLVKPGKNVGLRRQEDLSLLEDTDHGGEEWGIMIHVAHKVLQNWGGGGVSAFGLRGPAKASAI
jgi:hypothetical protein